MHNGPIRCWCAVIGIVHLAATPPVLADDTAYAFEAFRGVWTLEDDRFEQVWDGETLQTLTIPNHITRCNPVNTDHSILCAVDAGDLKGHILWVVDETGQRVEHLSHFGSRRVGTGEGQLDDAGNLTLTLRFADEPANTYRRYRYEWLGADRYKMTSIQYRDDDTPTGNWYGGTFVRVNLPR